MLSLQKAKSNVAQRTPTERTLRSISNSGVKVKDDGTFVTERPLLNDIKTLSKTAESADELFSSLSKKYLDAESRQVFLGNLQKEGILDKPKKGWMDALDFARSVKQLEKKGKLVNPAFEVGADDGFRNFDRTIGVRIRQGMGFRGKPAREGIVGRISRFYQKDVVTDLETREVTERWNSLPANAKEIFRTKKLKLARVGSLEPLSIDNITKQEREAFASLLNNGEIQPYSESEFEAFQNKSVADLAVDYKLDEEQVERLKQIANEPETKAMQFQQQLEDAVQNERKKVALTYGKEEITEELLFAGIEEDEVSKLMKEFPEVPSLKKRIKGAMDSDLLVEDATPPKKEDELLTREGFEEEDMPTLENEKLRSSSTTNRMNARTARTAKTSSDATIKRSVMNATVIQENEANSTLSKLGTTGMARRGINVGTSSARAIGEMATFGAIVGSTFVFSGENSTVFALGTTVTGIGYGALGIGLGAPTAGLGGVAVFLTGPVVSIAGGLASVFVYQTGKTLYMQTKLHNFEEKDKKNNTTTFYSLKRQTFVSVPNSQVKKFRLSNERLVLHAIFDGERLYRLAKE
jgi:SOS response regulatory protein OraA/RecX